MWGGQGQGGGGADVNVSYDRPAGTITATVICWDGHDPNVGTDGVYKLARVTRARFQHGECYATRKGQTMRRTS